MLLKEIPRDAQTRVLWLHHQAFGGDTACKQCKGACCYSCAKTNGYFRGTEQEHRERKEKFGFDDKTGYLGEHGCKLPVTERSAICLEFMCSGVNMGGGVPSKGVNKPFTQQQQDAAWALSDAFWGRDKKRA